MGLLQFETGRLFEERKMERDRTDDPEHSRQRELPGQRARRGGEAGKAWCSGQVPGAGVSEAGSRGRC